MQDLTSEFDRELLLVEEEATPGNTGYLEITINGELVHSKRNGDGYVDSELKFRRIADAVAKGLEWAEVRLPLPRPPWRAPPQATPAGRWPILGGAVVASRPPQLGPMPAHHPCREEHMHGDGFNSSYF